MKTTTGLFLLVFSLQALTSTAQPCTKEDILKQPGYWTPGLKSSTYGVAAADLARQQSIVANIIQPIQKKYASPRGVDIIFGGAHFENSRLPQISKPGNYYYAYFYIAEHPCVYTKEAMENRGSSAYLWICANDFSLEFGHSFFVPTKPNEENPKTDAFRLIDQKPVLKDGVWYWRDGKGSTGDYRWVISFDSKQPFIIITRKEMAERLKVYYQKKMKQSEDQFNETLKTNEETYQNIKKFNEKEATAFREQSKTFAEKMRSTELSMYGKSLAVVEGILKSSDSQALQQPAIIDAIKGFDQFEGFVNEDHMYAMFAMRPNPAYFNAQLPKSSPQFFTVHFSIGEFENNLLAEKAKEDLLKAIDFTVLKNMLGK
ncbi:MAG: hypothetical protein J0L66_02920 [Cytophagales bacterium]|nr:hypothetical protein [Cytophagales bacterium]